jgi:hypothetical protein
MSATTIAVAVTHDTVLAELPPEAESVMNKLPSPPRITGCNGPKFNKRFVFLFAPTGGKRCFTHPLPSLGASVVRETDPTSLLHIVSPQKENVAFV